VIDVAQNHLEAIPLEVPRSELVAVSRATENSDVVRVEGVDAVPTHCRDRNVLPGDGAAVFQPGSADIVAGDPQDDSDVTHKVVGGDVPLFDPEEQVLSLPAWLIGGDLFDEEVIRLVLERAANAGQPAGQIR
jgi:hypothetical protein